jgi:acyl-coenzyme A synthetase/AMP-(fatty) acid ligase
LSSKYRPSEVRIVPQLPRTASGKVKRGELRDKILNG